MTYLEFFMWLGLVYHINSNALTLSEEAGFIASPFEGNAERARSIFGNAKLAWITALRLSPP